MFIITNEKLKQDLSFIQNIFYISLNIYPNFLDVTSKLNVVIKDKMLNI